MMPPRSCEVQAEQLLTLTAWPVSKSALLSRERATRVRQSTRYELREAEWGEPDDADPARRSTFDGQRCASGLCTEVADGDTR